MSLHIPLHMISVEGTILFLLAMVEVVEESWTSEISAVFLKILIHYHPEANELKAHEHPHIQLSTLSPGKALCTTYPSDQRLQVGA